MVNVEIARFTPTEAYIADKSAGDAIWKYLASAPGAKAVYHGLTVQDPKSAFFVAVWETHEHVKAFIESPVFGEFKGATRTIAEGLKYLNNLDLGPNPYNAIEAPVTEIGHITLHEDVDVNVFLEKIGDIIEFVNGAGKSVGSYGGGASPVKENERQFMSVVGWESVEHFTKAVELVKEKIQALQSLGTLDHELVHVKFTKFQQ